MEKDNIYKQEGLDRIAAGISKAADFIRPTYGAAGGNIIIQEDLYPFHSVRNDGKAIMDAIHFADPIEEISANILREAGDNADKESGDGRKTTMILTDAIFREAKKYPDVFPTDLKRSLDECIPVINQGIDAATREIELDQVGSIATISSESSTIGKLVGEIYKEIGKNGIIEVDHSNITESFYVIKEGVRFRNCRFLAEYMVNEEDRAVYSKPKILVTRQKIVAISDIDPIFQKLEAAEIKSLVILCEDIDVSVLNALAFTHKAGIFKTLIIKAPTLWKDWVFEDMAEITGATILEPSSGLTWKTLEISHLGTCDKFITDREETRVLGIKDITAHVEKLTKMSESNDQLKVRTAWLQTKVAILKVGAGSESELSHISKKANDACAAAHLALKGGVIPGGGRALYDIAGTLPDTVGGKILTAALMDPHRQILTNLNLKGEPTDFPETVIDPALVVKNAVKNSISIAGTHLTAKGVIIIPKKPETKSTNHNPLLR